jgi:hypothetical protein
VLATVQKGPKKKGMFYTSVTGSFLTCRGKKCIRDTIKFTALITRLQDMFGERKM